MFPIRDENTSGVFPFINTGLIILTLYVFFLQLTASNPDTFVAQYALIPSQVYGSDYMTWLPFITSMFLHGGWLHIVGNLWFLWIFGDNIESAFGHIQYLFFYLFCGVLAGVVQYIASPYSSIPTLGASGAIAGVLGAYLSLFPDHRIDTIVLAFGGFITRTAISARVMVVYWFVIQLFSGVGSLGYASSGGVAWWAHVGGFVTGWIYSKVFATRSRGSV